jgi:hypothetical protein
MYYITQINFFHRTNCSINQPCIEIYTCKLFNLFKFQLTDYKYNLTIPTTNIQLYKTKSVILSVAILTKSNYNNEMCTIYSTLRFIDKLLNRVN